MWNQLRKLKAAAIISLHSIYQKNEGFDKNFNVLFAIWIKILILFWTKNINTDDEKYTLLYLYKLVF